MKTILIGIIVIGILSYLLCMLLIYGFQRSLLYFPTPYIDVPGLEATKFVFPQSELQGWIINPGKENALIYFGGNSELISDNIPRFRELFSSYSVYLINYRGYGQSTGKPTENGLKADALSIYDHLEPNHESISTLGRSLGSGIALNLAVNRRISKLLLLTPYDSIAEVAQHHYPMFPTRYLAKDKFDSAKIADKVTTDVLIVAAGEDMVVPNKHARILADKLINARVEFVMIEGAAHNNVTEYPEYHSALKKFIE